MDPAEIEKCPAGVGARPDSLESLLPKAAASTPAQAARPAAAKATSLKPEFGDRLSPGGEFLLWVCIALVLFHAGYVESVPHA